MNRPSKVTSEELFVRDLPSLCPICGGRYLGYRRLDTNQSLEVTSLQKIRTTCGALKCMDAESARHIQKAMNLCFQRMEEAKEQRKLKAEEDAQKAKQARLKRLGDFS